MNESQNHYAEWKKSDHSLHWEPLSCHSPLLPSLVRSTSELLGRPLSAVVMKQLQMLTDESLSSLAASGFLTSLIPRHSFQTSATEGTLTQQPRSLGLGLPQLGWLGLALCLGASSLVMPGTLLWCNSSPPMPFWALPSWRPWDSFPWW